MRASARRRRKRWAKCAARGTRATNGSSSATASTDEEIETLEQMAVRTMSDPDREPLTLAELGMGLADDKGTRPAAT